MIYVYWYIKIYPQVCSTHISCARYFVYEFKHGKSHMSLPVPVPTLKLFLYTHINSQEYTYHITHTCLYEPMLCKLTFLSLPLQALTVRTSLFTCKYSQVIIHVSDHSTFCIQTHCVQTHICLCPRGCTTAHTSNLFVYMHISTNIDISYDGHFCIRTYGAETYIWVCLRERSQLELFVYIQILTSIHV